MEMAGRIIMRVDFWIYLVMGVIFLSGLFMCLWAKK